MESISTGPAEAEGQEGKMCLQQALAPPGCGVPSPAAMGCGAPSATAGGTGHDSGHKPDEFIRVWNFSRERGTWGQRGLCSRATPSTAELQLVQLQ